MKLTDEELKILKEALSVNKEIVFPFNTKDYGDRLRDKIEAIKTSAYEQGLRVGLEKLYVNMALTCEYCHSENNIIDLCDINGNYYTDCTFETCPKIAKLMEGVK